MSERGRGLGSEIFGLQVPAEFRGFGIRFRSPVRVLGDFAGWLEPRLVLVDGAAPADQALEDQARERRVLVERVIEVHDVAQGEAVRERLRMALVEAGVEDIDAARRGPGSTRAPAPDVASGARRRRLGERILGPDGLRVPKEFRGLWVRFESSVRVLDDFAEWLESSLAVVPSNGGGDVEAQAQARQVLVKRVIEVRDIAKGEDVREGLRAALAEVGVREIDAAHERFDPARHMAVDRLPPTAPDQDGMVAEVERPGYRDGDLVVRRPEVVVYHKDASG